MGRRRSLPHSRGGILESCKHPKLLTLYKLPSLIASLQPQNLWSPAVNIRIACLMILCAIKLRFFGCAHEIDCRHPTLFMKSYGRGSIFIEPTPALECPEIMVPSNHNPKAAKCIQKHCIFGWTTIKFRGLPWPDLAYCGFIDSCLSTSLQ